jgi:Tol biopolymer transport system component
MNWRAILGPAVLAAAFAFAALLLPTLSQATAPQRNGEIAFSAGGDGSSQVFTVKPNGTRLREITHSKAMSAGQYGLSWSPDGRDLLYTVTYPNGPDAIVKSRADGTGATFISPPCGGTCLGDDDPVYSPDGKKIAFVRAFGPVVNDNAAVAAIFTMNADGSDLTQLTHKSTPTSSEDHGPQWSPNSKKIAFTRINTTARPKNGTAIEVMNADGSNIQRLTAFRTGAGNPHWSPSGKRIVFNTSPAPFISANLFTMRPDGTHRVAITHYTGGTLQAFADAWSPDGRQIVYRRLAFSGTDTEVGGFYIITIRNKHIRRLTHVRITSDELAAWGRRPG